MMKRIFTAFIALVSTYTHGGESSFNAYILSAADSMSKEVAGRGYDLSSAFTEDLRYGASCCVKATNGGKTMCVAAAAEVVIRAINSYSVLKGSENATKSLPLVQWTGHKYLNIRPHFFQYREAESKGPGDAFTRFGIGQQVEFDALEPGDFIAFSRFNGSGHSVIFINYLLENKNTGSLPANIIGFRYISAQASTSGVGYRDAYFGNLRDTRCPAIAKPKSDCGVIKGSYLNAGRVWSPEKWHVTTSIEALKTKYLQRQTESGATSESAEKRLDLELAPIYSIDYSE